MHINKTQRIFNMLEREFRELYNSFQSKWKTKEAEWNNTIALWKNYYREIISENGLPFEKWIKGENYLPNFIDRTTICGRARIGDYEQVMIYCNSTQNDKRNGKYFDRYIDLNVAINKRSKSYQDILYVEKEDERVKNDYNSHIKPLLKRIAQIRTFNDLYNLEEENEYKNFSAKQILRKMTQFVSYCNFQECEYNHKIMWIFQDESIDKLLNILFEKDDEERPNKDASFFEKNCKIYERAKKWIKGDDTFNFVEELKLNELLWKITNFGSEFKEITNYVNLNVVYHGAPGTGKTYSILSAVKLLTRGDSQKYIYIQFHPSFTYQDFVEGIKPVGIINNQLNLKVVNGVFKQFCIYVKDKNEQFYRDNQQIGEETKDIDKRKPNTLEKWPHYYFIIDEINRGNLSSILGETLSIIEKDYRDYDFSGHYGKDNSDNLIETPLSNVISGLENENDKKACTYKSINGKAMFGIPFNIHIIGSMNDVDKNIDTFDLALRRRFKWLYKTCDYEAITSVLLDNGLESDVVNQYVKDCENLNLFISEKGNDSLGLGDDYQIGQSIFMKIQMNKRNPDVKKAKMELFVNYIEPILKEYIREMSEENEVTNHLNNAMKAFGVGGE